MPIGDGSQRFDIGRVTVQIDGQNGAGSARDEALDFVDSDGVIRLQHITKQRASRRID